MAVIGGGVGWWVVTVGLQLVIMLMLAVDVVVVVMSVVVVVVDTVMVVEALKNRNERKNGNVLTNVICLKSKAKR